MTARTGFEIFEANVSEMNASVESASTDIVPVSADLLRAVSEGDDKPLFVTMNIATEGVSKNGRHYSRETIQAMADQINAEAVDGHNGHLTDKERATKRPHPVALWLGARVIEKNGKAYLYAKGYVMPEEGKLRSYLKRAKAVGKNVAVSVFGKAEKAVYDKGQKAYSLVNFTLQSIDFARSKSEGIPNDGTLILASEMVNDKGEINVDRVQTIQSLSADELREHNPGLVAEMEQVNPDTAVVVSEMEAITEIVGENASVAVSEMVRENRELKLDRELQAKVKIRGARPALREMVIAEMETAENQATIDVAEMVNSVLAGDEARAIISTHREAAPVINPTDATRTHEVVGQRQFTNVTKRKK